MGGLVSDPNSRFRAAQFLMSAALPGVTYRVGVSQSMQLRYAAHGAVWLILYLVFILAPLLALLAGSLPPTRDFWTEFSVAIGYAGLAMMACSSASRRASGTSPSRGARTSSITFTAKSR